MGRAIIDSRDAALGLFPITTISGRLGQGNASTLPSNNIAEQSTLTLRWGTGSFAEVASILRGASVGNSSASSTRSIAICGFDTRRWDMPQRSRVCFLLSLVSGPTLRLCRSSVASRRAVKSVGQLAELSVVDAVCVAAAFEADTSNISPHATSRGRKFIVPYSLTMSCLAPGRGELTDSAAMTSAPTGP